MKKIYSAIFVTFSLFVIVGVVFANSFETEQNNKTQQDVICGLKVGNQQADTKSKPKDNCMD